MKNNTCDAANESRVNVIERVRNFNSALDRLMRLHTSDALSVDAFIRHVTVEASNQLKVDRVSVWALSEDHQQITCSDLFDASVPEHAAGTILHARDFPSYFEAMLNDRVIDADDAATDPRTCEFKDTYLAPNRIVSMLDAQIRSAAGPRGVVCAESVGESRKWTPDETAFLVSIAELVGFAKDRRDRNIVLAKLEDTNARLQRKNEELNLAKEEIESVALEDALTGLPNRRHLEKTAQTLIDETIRSDSRLVVLHIDLDHFKEINDRLGHAAGDAVLKHLAEGLKTLVSDTGFAARIGGDEFVALVPEGSEAIEWTSIVQHIFDHLNEPLFIDRRECKIGVSIGVALLGDEKASAAQLLGNADIALYRAKQLGRNRAEFYCGEMRREAEEQRELHEEILSSLDAGHFEPYFQPQFDASTLQLVGVEALARWRHPKRGLLLPAAFIEAAEEVGCVDRIDQQILEHAVTIIKEWEQNGLAVPRLAVNVSGRRLSSSSLVDCVKRLPPMQCELSFELVETIFLDQTSKQVRKNLRELRRLGVEIEIDDFGTGHTSIAGLMNIRPKRLKIDRQLIGNVEKNPTIAKLIRAIVDIAQSLDVEVVAEGIETAAQATTLSRIGCQVLQGFCLGRPISTEKFQARYADSLRAAPELAA